MSSMARPRTLYSQLLSSHLQIAVIAAVLLTVCLGMIAYFQQGSAKIADVRLPSSVMSGRIIRSIEISNSLLRSWVLMGDKAKVAQRRTIWADTIEPTLNSLDALSNKNQNSQSVDLLHSKIQQLKESQWWVEEIAGTVGNKPARLIYEKDLLPIFRQIEAAMIGISNISEPDSSAKNNNFITEIRLSAAIAHQQLSEAIRRLSEVIHSGSATEISEFYSGSNKVEILLSQLRDRLKQSTDTHQLVVWILREYYVYEQLAEQIITTRQSHDWNRALNILRTETEPLAEEISLLLTKTQEEHNYLLQKDVAQNAQISRIGAFITIFMIFFLGVISWFFARTKSHQLVLPIEALSEASDKLADTNPLPVQLAVVGPAEIAHLTKRFNYMSRELTTKTNALKRTNKDLQDYAHIITHDMKSPLINIKGHVNLIKRHLQKIYNVASNPDKSEQQLRDTVTQTISVDIPDAIHFVELSLSKASHLIRGVFDNSKLIFRPLEYEVIDMNRLVKQIVESFSHNFSNVDFICHDLPELYSDPFLIEHSISNLIDNSLKYLDKKRRGEIIISGEITRNEVYISVRDNGIGIKTESINVFQLFSRGDTDIEGTGVGLALVRTMLTKLNGSILFSNNENHGVTFTICHPNDNNPGQALTRKPS